MTEKGPWRKIGRLETPDTKRDPYFLNMTNMDWINSRSCNVYLNYFYEMIGQTIV